MSAVVFQEAVTVLLKNHSVCHKGQQELTHIDDKHGYWTGMVSKLLRKPHGHKGFEHHEELLFNRGKFSPHSHRRLSNIPTAAQILTNTPNNPQHLTFLEGITYLLRIYCEVLMFHPAIQITMKLGSKKAACAPQGWWQLWDQKQKAASCCSSSKHERECERMHCRTRASFGGPSAERSKGKQQAATASVIAKPWKSALTLALAGLLGSADSEDKTAAYIK